VGAVKKNQGDRARCIDPGKGGKSILKESANLTVTAEEEK